MKNYYSFILFLSLFFLPQAIFGGTISYHYDDLGRLNNVAYSSGRKTTYSYDLVGNRLSKDHNEALATDYENGENKYGYASGGYVAGWDVYDNNPAGAAITAIIDPSRGSRVVELSGTGTDNGYRLRNPDGSWWNNDVHKVIEWSMNYSENFIIYIAVQTSEGFRYIYYTAADYDNLGDDTYIHHGLGSDIKDGDWHTIIRDLEYDLHDAQPGNNLVSVLGFLIRGSGRVDDIRTLSAVPADQDSDNDGVTDIDEITIYGTLPYNADTDNDGIYDGDELAYWGTAWSDDIDGDTIINLLDTDSDNDGISDGDEIEQGTDPGDAGSVSATLNYEDAEDGNVSGWTVYDNDPAGAVINNIAAPEHGGQVIEFTGTGTDNGYRLRNPDGSWWNNGAHKTIEWSMNYAENLIIYIAVQTSEGFRYIYYTAADYDNLGDDTYIHHGLGSAIKDGDWHTIIRDLEYDLHDAQPGNNLVSVLGFLIRGSGRVDDIRTLK
ncbi:MAG: hypothetical protein COA36_14720 [Desulfotalea sp.]|nr:MAG: hypothetical protein COA36_14720 [Desulfotalea sp.]